MINTVAGIIVLLSVLLVGYNLLLVLSNANLGTWEVLLLVEAGTDRQTKGSTAIDEHLVGCGVFASLNPL